MTQDLIKQLRETAEFQTIMAEVYKTRPVIPEYVPQKTRDETENLMEHIKYQSAMRAGFDVLYRALAGQQPKE